MVRNVSTTPCDDRNGRAVLGEHCARTAASVDEKVDTGSGRKGGFVGRVSRSPSPLSLIELASSDKCAPMRLCFSALSTLLRATENC